MTRLSASRRLTVGRHPRKRSREMAGVSMVAPARLGAHQLSVSRRPKKGNDPPETKEVGRRVTPSAPGSTD